jgi:hypothetical protein|tara:strand:- start:4285 stop:4527 length:243 start_codon:yes stop_codon:yes gene_type:complete
MDLNNIPNIVKQILQDRELPMDQKMTAFMMFMPKLPQDPKLDVILNDNLMIGQEIKSLIDDGKIELGKFDKNFHLDVKVL